jgi:two-component system, response regulator, stage 0 sporulation protein F
MALILVVDDDAEIRDTMAEVLSEAGYHVETAADGAKALQRLESTPPPDAAVVDLMMPLMDGWEFIRRLRDDERLRATPIVIITAFGSRALSSAPVAAAYLSKPLSVDRLLEAVRIAIARRSV